MNHTPTPWRVISGGDGLPMIAADGPTGQVELATVYREAEYAKRLPAEGNAEFIVRACNAHDAFVAACQATLHELYRLYHSGMSAEEFAADPLVSQLNAALSLATFPAAPPAGEKR